MTKLSKLFQNTFKKRKTNKSVKIGVAFGGGGTKAFAHLGAIKAFEEYGIKFDFVSGTSAGSLIGAFYAAGLSYEQIYKLGKNLKVSDFKPNKVFFIPSKTDGVEKLVEKNIPYENIEDLPIPYASCAVDLYTTKEVTISKGSIAKAVAASCALPGFYAPVEYKDMLLADGGLHNTIPATIPKHFGCDYVVGIDVNPTRGQGAKSAKVVDVLTCSLGILLKNNTRKGYENSDVMVQIKTGKYKFTKLDGYEEMIEEGYRATIDKMDEILELFGKKNIKENRPDKGVLVV